MKEYPTDVHTPVALDLTREELRRTTGQNDVLWSVFPTPPSERDGQRRISRSSGPLWRSTNRSESSSAWTSETHTRTKMDTVHPYTHIYIDQRDKIPSQCFWFLGQTQNTHTPINTIHITGAKAFIFKYHNETWWMCFQSVFVWMKSKLTSKFLHHCALTTS